MKFSKQERQIILQKKINEIPFLTDEDLSVQLSVSVPTIRLDRLELGIPELRERVKNLAQTNLNKVKSLQIDEVIGDVIDLQLNKSGISILEIQKQHAFQKTKIARGHYLFAQANSLAVALIDSDVVLTASANIKFIRTVHVGEKCIAKAVVEERSVKKSMYSVIVKTFVNDEIVFEGEFIVSKYIEDK